MKPNFLIKQYAVFFSLVTFFSTFHQSRIFLYYIHMEM